MKAVNMDPDQFQLGRSKVFIKNPESVREPECSFFAVVWSPTQSFHSEIVTLEKLEVTGFQWIWFNCSEEKKIEYFVKIEGNSEILKIVFKHGKQWWRNREILDAIKGKLIEKSLSCRWDFRTTCQLISIGGKSFDNQSMIIRHPVVCFYLLWKPVAHPTYLLLPHHKLSLPLKIGNSDWSLPFWA